MNKVYLDGKIVPENDALIPVSDRGLLMGDGVFVTIQVKEGTPFFLKRHLDKLNEQAKKLKLALPVIEEAEVAKLIEENHAHTGVWRLKIYYTGGSDTAMRLPENRTGHLIMILKPYVVPPLVPLNVRIFPHPINTLTSSLKSLSHIVRYMIMEEALQKGFDDYITKTESGILLESAFGNIFWIKENHFFTPDPQLPLHHGITISVITEMMSTLGFEPHFVKIKDIPEGSLMFRANTMGGIRPIGTIEGMPQKRDISLEKRLLSAYESKINEELAVRYNSL